MHNQPYHQSSAQAAAGYDEGLRKYMLGVYNYMTAGVALTGFVSYLMANMLAPEMIGMLGLASIVAMLVYAFVVLPKIPKMSLKNAQLTFWSYAAVIGLMLSHIFLQYTGMSIAKTFLITAGAFAGLSLWGYSTKKDLSGMGSFLVMGVWGLFLAIVVNVFLQSPVLHMAYSAIGVLIFAGLTAYDTQAIRRSYYAVGGNEATAAKMSIMGALRLYMDFINLFIFLLQFLGNRD